MSDYISVKVNNMSREATYSSASKQLRLLKMILESYYGLHSFSEIISELEISEKTLSRYLKVFKEVFPDYIEIKKGAEIGREPAQERFLIFKRFELESRTGYQLAPLYLSRFFMSFLQGTLLDESLSDAVTLFETTVDMGRSGRSSGQFSQKFFAISTGPKSYSDYDDVIEEILQALIRQNPLEISYLKPKAENEESYSLLPLTLVVYKQGLYLIADKRSAQMEPRFFAIERIRDITRLKTETFEYPLSFSPEKYCASSFGIFQGEAEEIVIEFAADYARSYIEPRKWHQEQKLVYSNNGTARLHLKVSGREEVLAWVLSHGRHARVLQPQGLVTAVREELQKAADSYSRQ
jgi:predicted DNA-binding transcriptional regulator YafY